MCYKQLMIQEARLLMNISGSHLCFQYNVLTIFGSHLNNIFYTSIKPRKKGVIKTIVLKKDDNIENVSK